MTVRMTHPDHDGEYYAQPSQVPFLKDARWQVVPGQDEQGEEWPAELQRFEGQDQVKIRHPSTGGETVVAASAVPHLREKGWEVVQAEPEAEQPEDDGLDGQTVDQLRDLARALDLPVSGTKAELLERLRSAPDQDQAEPAEPAAKEE